MARPLAEERARLRVERIGPRYSGWGHLAFTSVVSALVIVGTFGAVRSPSWAELAVVPGTFLFANLAEYLGHRFVMHRPRPGLRAVFRRHTLQHHVFFRHDAMAIDGVPDFALTLFPPVLVAFFFGAFGLPPGLALALSWSRDAALLYAGTAVAYFLLYEWLHLAWHLPDDTPLRHVPGYARLRALHRDHHDPAWMSRYNFNITFPIADLGFGTLRRRGGGK